MTKEEFAWSRLGIPLMWLAGLDNVPAANSLADALGDRYLYRHNPVFAAVRDAAIHFGYGFSAADSPLWRDYQSCSLVCLDRILHEKTIPYVDTGTTFQRIIESHPDARLSPGFIRGSIKRNFVFHESAHCVAHSILRSMDDELRAIEPDAARRGVLEGVLAESFANAVELLGSAFPYMPLSDGLFYFLNSYHAFKPERGGLLNAAAAEAGKGVRFAALFFSCFEANVTVGEPGESTIDRIARSAESEPRRIRALTEVAFSLHRGFRESTTPAYFELLGWSSQYHTIAGEGWLDVKRNQCFARDLAERLWDAVGNA